MVMDARTYADGVVVLVGSPHQSGVAVCTRLPVMKRSLVFLLSCLVFASGCSESTTSTAEQVKSPSASEGSSASESAQPAPKEFDVQAEADKIVAAVESATESVRLTEDNDPNNLIGRPNGYEDGVVIKESSLDCSESFGTDCGVMIEVWSDAAQATKRAEYIQVLQIEAPMLGNEWHYMKDGALLRISGEVKPSVAKKYAEAFGGEQYKSSYTPTSTSTE